jgi:hypothetical protein
MAAAAAAVATTVSAAADLRMDTVNSFADGGA